MKNDDETRMMVAPDSAVDVASLGNEHGAPKVGVRSMGDTHFGVTQFGETGFRGETSSGAGGRRADRAGGEQNDPNVTPIVPMDPKVLRSLLRPQEAGSVVRDKSCKGPVAVESSRRLAAWFEQRRVIGVLVGIALGVGAALALSILIFKEAPDVTSDQSSKESRSVRLRAQTGKEEVQEQLSTPPIPEKRAVSSTEILPKELNEALVELLQGDCQVGVRAYQRFSRIDASYPWAKFAQTASEYCQARAKATTFNQKERELD